MAKELTAQQKKDINTIYGALKNAKTQNPIFKQIVEKIDSEEKLNNMKADDIDMLTALAYSFAANKYGMLNDRSKRPAYEAVFVLLNVLDKGCAGRLEKAFNEDSHIAKIFHKKNLSEDYLHPNYGIVNIGKCYSNLKMKNPDSGSNEKEFVKFNEDAVEEKRFALNKLRKYMTTSPIDPFYHKNSREYKDLIQAIKASEKFAENKLAYIKDRKNCLSDTISKDIENIEKQLNKRIEECAENYINAKSALPSTDRGMKRLQAAVDALNFVNPEKAKTKILEINKNRNANYDFEEKVSLFVDREYVRENVVLKEDHAYERCLAAINIYDYSRLNDTVKPTDLHPNTLAECIVAFTMKRNLTKMGEAEFNKKVKENSYKIPSHHEIWEAAQEIYNNKTYKAVLAKYQESNKRVKMSDMVKDFVNTYKAEHTGKMPVGENKAVEMQNLNEKGQAEVNTEIKFENPVFNVPQ